jgi:hypothetical protein
MEYSLGGVDDTTKNNTTEINVNDAKDVSVDLAKKVINKDTGKKVLEVGKDVGEGLFKNIINTPTFYSIIRQVIKYLIQGFVVAMAGYYIPAKKPQLNEIIMISLVAASTFAILEIYMPDAYMAARFGFGFQTGTQLIPKL